jgi:ribulose kinase
MPHDTIPCYLGLFATSHADTMRALTFMSTGKIFAAFVPSTCIVLIKSLPAPTKTLVGPYELSIQPLTGSLRVPTTATETNELINHSHTYYRNVVAH